jgi:hypothetical protein
VSCGKSPNASIRSNELFIEGVCVWFVDIVIDTSLVGESCWLPELLDEVVRVIIIKEEL